MDKTVFISLPIEDFQTVIIDCVNSCLKNNKQEPHPPQPEQPELLSIDEVAALLHLTKPTVYSKHSRDELPGVFKRGKRLFFDRQIIVDWIKEGRRKTKAELVAEVDLHLSNKNKGLQNGK